MTLLRHWIDSRFQESNATPQAFGTLVVPGAAQALSAQFVEQVGLPRQHLRVLVAVDAAVAIVDFGAAARIWAEVAPSFDAFLKSLRVERPRPIA